MKFRYYFFKDQSRLYDKAELLTYLEAQPFMKLDTSGNVRKAIYHNTLIGMDAEFVLNTKSIVPNIQRLNPRFLDLNFYVEFEVLNNTYKVSKIVDMIEVICKRFDFYVYNEYFEDVSAFKRTMLLNAFELVKTAYKKKFEEEFMAYSKLDKRTLDEIYQFIEIEDQIPDINNYQVLNYVFLKEKESRQVYVTLDFDFDRPIVIPPCAQLCRIKTPEGDKIISYQDFNKKISKYLTLVDARLYNVFMADEKNYKKVKKIIQKSKFDYVKVELKEVPFSHVLDI